VKQANFETSLLTAQTLQLVSVRLCDMIIVGLRRGL